MIFVVTFLCERMDCKHWIDGECVNVTIQIKERTISEDQELAVCSNYEIIPAFC